MIKYNLAMSNFPELMATTKSWSREDQAGQSQSCSRCCCTTTISRRWSSSFSSCSTCSTSDEAEAFAIMLKVHNEGVGVAGTYPYEIATTKSEKTMNLAKAREYPLLCTVEEE